MPTEFDAGTESIDAAAQTEGLELRLAAFHGGDLKWSLISRFGRRRAVWHRQLELRHGRSWQRQQQPPRRQLSADRHTERQVQLMRPHTAKPPDVAAIAILVAGNLLALAGVLPLGEDRFVQLQRDADVLIRLPQPDDDSRREQCPFVIGFARQFNRGDCCCGSRFAFGRRRVCDEFDVVLPRRVGQHRDQFTELVREVTHCGGNGIQRRPLVRVEPHRIGRHRGRNGLGFDGLRFTRLGFRSHVRTRLIQRRGIGIGRRSRLLSRDHARDEPQRTAQRQRDSFPPIHRQFPFDRVPHRPV